MASQDDFRRKLGKIEYDSAVLMAELNSNNRDMETARTTWAASYPEGYASYCFQIETLNRQIQQELDFQQECRNAVIKERDEADLAFALKLHSQINNPIA